MVTTEIKTETRYQVLKNIDTKRLTCLGILPVHLLDWIFYYEKYLQELDKNTKPVSIQFICDEYGVSRSFVYKIIDYMGG